MLLVVNTSITVTFFLVQEMWTHRLIFFAVISFGLRPSLGCKFLIDHVLFDCFTYLDMQYVFFRGTVDMQYVLWMTSSAFLYFQYSIFRCH